MFLHNEWVINGLYEHKLILSSSFYHTLKDSLPSDHPNQHGVKMKDGQVNTVPILATFAYTFLSLLFLS